MFFHGRTFLDGFFSNFFLNMVGIKKIPGWMDSRMNGLSGVGVSLVTRYFRNMWSSFSIFEEWYPNVWSWTCNCRNNFRGPVDLFYLRELFLVTCPYPLPSAHVSTISFTWENGSWGPPAWISKGFPVKNPAPTIARVYSGNLVPCCRWIVPSYPLVCLIFV